MPANSVTASYDVDNSLRFDGNSDLVFGQSDGSVGEKRTFTVSAWVKKSKTTGEQVIIASTPGNENFFSNLKFNSDDDLHFINYQSNAGGTNIQLITDRKFRDPSAWYHIFLVVDTTQGTAANRVKMFVNGVQETSFSTETYPDQNLQTTFNQASYNYRIGVNNDNNGGYFDGYMCEVALVAGVAHAVTDFGQFNINGIWQPKDISGLTYEADNSFYLEFKGTSTGQNSNGLGADTSGNGHHFASSELAATNQSTDTCTNNFATFNAAHATLANAGFSEGNLQFASDGSASTQNPASSSIAVSTGKWYAEFNVVAESTDSGSFSYVGVAGTATWLSAANNAYYIGNQADTIAFNGNQAVYSASNEIDSSETNYANGNIVGVAADFTNSKIYFHVNGTYINSGDPAGASNGYNIPATAQSFYYFAVSTFGKNATWQANFGSPPYAISSGNADADGHGNFEYAVPSGYFALCSKNLAEYG